MCKIKVIMKIILIVLGFRFCTAIIYLRPVNDRGPMAVELGKNCLSTIAVGYFYDAWSNRTKNMAYLHTSNMSSPAAEIETGFLTVLHNLLTTYELRKYVLIQINQTIFQLNLFFFFSIQLGIISDSYPIKGLVNVNPNEVSYTNYYILIVDDFKKVSLIKYEYEIYKV